MIKIKGLAVYLVGNGYLIYLLIVNFGLIAVLLGAAVVFSITLFIDYKRIEMEVEKLR